MERSDKLDHLVSQISTSQFADPFPSEYATRDQVETLRDAVDGLRLDMGNARGAIIAVLKDRLDAIDARLAALEAK